MATDTDYRLSNERLAEMQAEVLAVNEANGWFEDERNFEDGIALLHTEVAEMVEAYRRWGMDDATRSCDHLVHKAKPTKNNLEVLAEHLCKPEGVGSEMADVLIRLLDEAQRQHVFLRRGHLQANDPKHPFTRVTNGLHRSIARLDSDIERLTINGYHLAIWDWDMEQGLAHIWADLEGAAHWWGIDLEAEYTRKLAYNRTRGHKHGGKRL